MRANGNGTPAVCVENLLQTVRGEVPYERIKGLDPNLIDRPASNVSADLRQDVEWLIETYEPRVEASSIAIHLESAVDGRFTITTETAEKEG